MVVRIGSDADNIDIAAATDLGEILSDSLHFPCSLTFFQNANMDSLHPACERAHEEPIVNPIVIYENHFPKREISKSLSCTHSLTLSDSHAMAFMESFQKNPFPDLALPF